MVDLFLAAANAGSGKPTEPGCTNCGEAPNLEAVILYPSLGTPLLLAPGQRTCTLYLAVSAATKAALMLDPAGQCAFMHIHAGRHLRVLTLDKKLSEEKDGQLFSDGKTYPSARKAIKSARWIGSLGKTRLFTNRPKTLGFTLSADLAAIYPPFSEVFELELDLTVPPFNVLPSRTPHSLAWMVKLDRDSKSRLAWPGDYIHCNDKYIRQYFLAQVANGHQHCPEMALFDLGLASHPDTNASLTQTQGDPSLQLWAWHPILEAKADQPLKIAHFSDVHVNVRQNSLARSPACLLEGAKEAGRLAEPVAKGLTNTFVALHDLVAQSSRQADAIVLTGDLIDFNRNLVPRQRDSGQVGPHWEDFNVLARLTDKQCYQRGLDDMLVYGLIRQAYVDQHCPVFLTSGNHEAYQVPYGISPRVDLMRDVIKGLAESEPAETPDHLNREINDLKDDDLAERSAYQKKKANEGIAADHNLTIYEATLAYGPTYAQVVTTENFSGKQLDWFHALFSPLDNWCLPFGGDPGSPTQLFVGWGWGGTENYKNPGAILPLGSDKQGAGILPRADKSINDAQKELLQLALDAKTRSGAKVCSFSHFTFINFDNSVPFDGVARELWPDDGVFNQFNTGTCEKNRAWFFKECMNRGVDYHFSGHSHRAGVYRARYRPGATPDGAGGVMAATPATLNIHLACDPAFTPVPGGDGTTFIVSSSGGPLGLQHLRSADRRTGGGAGWVLRPPSGTLVDTARGEITQIKSVKSGKPRLCVTLDYLHVLEQGAFLPGGADIDAQGRFEGQLDAELAALDCIAGMSLWVFEAVRGEEKDLIRTWHPVPVDCRISGRQVKGRLGPEGLALLERLSGVGAIKAFAQLQVRAPQAPWAADMDCDDPWVFPVAIVPGEGQYQYHLERPAGEKGEVPEWEWLALRFPEKYPRAKAIINGAR